jgi:Sec-independent protein translocase protein TatA
MGDVAKGIKSFKKGMSDNPDQSTSTSEDTSNKDQNSENK